MSRYGFNSRAEVRKPGGFHERAFRRQGLAEWDAKWHVLSPAARSDFLHKVKGPAGTQADHAPSYLIAKDQFSPGTLEELVAAGFVKLLPGRSKKTGDRAFAPSALYDFAVRVRMLDRFRLLPADLPATLTHYVRYAFETNNLLTFLHIVVQKAELNFVYDLDTLLSRYVRNRRWPGWFLAMKKDPKADLVVKAVQEAGGPVPVTELPGRLAGMEPDDARTAMDRLISGLVLFEGLDPMTSEIVVDFLPPVREGLANANRPPSRPPLTVRERLTEVGPEEGPVLADLRAFLLEVIADPPRLRQARDLFQKEVGRFLKAMEPLPSWLSDRLDWSEEKRVNLALAWARQLELVIDLVEGAQPRLGITVQGQSWLSSGPDVQYASVYRLITSPPSRRGEYIPYWDLFADTTESSFYRAYQNDTAFLGLSLLVQKVASGSSRATPMYWNPKPEDLVVLRESLDRALSVLKPGTFYRMGDIAAHLAYGQHNPIHLGLAPEKVVIFQGEEVIPPLEELREEAGRSLISTFLTQRLIPMGAVQAALDSEGKVCVARGPRLDAYFGRKMAATEMATPQATGSPRVVVQPDFSVILIGPVTSAAADLAPFCDRATAGTSGGAMILKLTRESVIRAVSNGLQPAQILDRLRKYASHDLPVNVVREVQEWSGRVRRITLKHLYALRCPDPETGDRAMDALKRRAERLNETTIAVEGKLTAADRTRLRVHGILVDGEDVPTSSRAGSGTSRRRRSW